jgi:SAM-dependent methyltransferase
MEGLDFGCGPNPVLPDILKSAGYGCLNYDPIFFLDFPDERVDFIFATETFEHFFNPLREMKFITALLRPGGILTVMTQRWKSPDQFADWWYVRDITHVSFFHKKTFDYICSPVWVLHFV